MAKRKLKGVADATRASLSQVEVVESEEKELYAHVRAYIASARETVYAVANSAMVEAYWNVGREIVEKQGGSGRAAYGDGLIDRIAAKLTAEFGPGYTRSNLRTMRQYYEAVLSYVSNLPRSEWQIDLDSLSHLYNRRKRGREAVLL